LPKVCSDVDRSRFQNLPYIAGHSHPPLCPRGAKPQWKLTRFKLLQSFRVHIRPFNYDSILHTPY
jgi:hypothetical protein